jgi:type III pantothenate kinase
MSLLCIDVGNTSTHWGQVKNHAVITSGDIPTDSLMDSAHSPFQKILEGGKFTGIALASVVPNATVKLLPLITAAGLPFHHLRHDTIKGLNFDYPKPAEVGQDRLANCIGAQHLVGAPAVIIDMGTATTFDILSVRGYAGGIIAPGLSVMTHYLHAQTALLPELDSKDLLGGPIIGKSTIDAMRAGCAIGFSGMVAALLEAVTSELKTQNAGNPSVLATGGASPFLPAAWAGKIRHEPNLTLIGLAVSYERTQA